MYGQNGVAERSIQTVVNSARTMMLHQALMWPEQFDMRLWPFTLTHAVYLWNHLHNDNGIAPIELYTSSKLDGTRLRNGKVRKCPAYILDAWLQDGKILPKWDPKRRRGQYLGKLTSHASLVGIIRNLNSGYISPQFHIIYNNIFQTAMGGYENDDAIATHIWESLITENDQQK